MSVVGIARIVPASERSRSLPSILMQNDMLAAIITAIVCSLGVLANLFVLLYSHKLSSMNSSFGTITKYIALCNVLLCFDFLIYVFPMQLSSSSNAFLNYSHIFGLFAMIFYGSSNQSHLLIALNRFCATFLPQQYSFLFNKRSTVVLVYLTLLLSAVIYSICYELLGCQFVFVSTYWTFHFVSNALCDTVTWYSDFVLNLSLVASTLIINLITAFKAATESRKLMNAIGLQVSSSQKRRERSFITQTFMQGIIVFLGQITYYIVTPFLQNEVLVFFFSTLWAFMQAFEGLIILLSNRDIRNKALGRRRSTTADRLVVT